MTNQICFLFFILASPVCIGLTHTKKNHKIENQKLSNNLRKVSSLFDYRPSTLAVTTILMMTILMLGAINSQTVTVPDSCILTKPFLLLHAISPPLSTFYCRTKNWMKRTTRVYTRAHQEKWPWRQKAHSQRWPLDPQGNIWSLWDARLPLSPFSRPCQRTSFFYGDNRYKQNPIHPTSSNLQPFPPPGQCNCAFSVAVPTSLSWRTAAPPALAQNPTGDRMSSRVFPSRLPTIGGTRRPLMWVILP